MRKTRAKILKATLKGVFGDEVPKSVWRRFKKDYLRSNKCQ